MLFPVFSQSRSQSKAEKLPSSNKKNVLELSSKEKVLEQKEKMCYFILYPSILKDDFSSRTDPSIFTSIEPLLLNQSNKTS